ncbi:hypothetical protein V8E52_009309 [Russula decolorans]
MYFMLSLIYSLLMDGGCVWYVLAHGALRKPAFSLTRTDSSRRIYLSVTHFSAHMRNNLFFLFQPPPPSPSGMTSVVTLHISLSRCFRRPQMIFRNNLAYGPWMSCRSAGWEAG